MPTPAKSWFMLQVVLTYTKQRFNLLRFSLLALFLLLYAVGTSGLSSSWPYLFFPLLTILYGFRLFDDLANKSADAGKADRVYTQPAAHRQLYRFCLFFTFLLSGLIAALDLQTYWVWAGFIFLNGAAYYWLFCRGQWRYILPLLKYPFLCFLLMYYAAENHRVSADQALVCLSLLPVFLLFETLSDPSFKMNLIVFLALYLIAHVLLGLFWEDIRFDFFLLLFALLLPVVLLNQRKARPYTPYLTLLYFLTLRLIATYDI